MPSCILCTTCDIGTAEGWTIPLSVSSHYGSAHIRGTLLLMSRCGKRMQDAMYQLYYSFVHHTAPFANRYRQGTSTAYLLCIVIYTGFVTIGKCKKLCFSSQKARVDSVCKRSIIIYIGIDKSQDHSKVSVVLKLQNPLVKSENSYTSRVMYSTNSSQYCYLVAEYWN